MSNLPSRTLAELAGQHAGLRAILDECEALVAARGAGAVVDAQLAVELARLRVEFAAHNRAEARALGPLLAACGAFGAVHVDAMRADHRAEARALASGRPDAPAVELRAALAELRATLEAEEQGFLNGRLLHDDLVVVEADG